MYDRVNKSGGDICPLTPNHPCSSGSRGRRPCVPTPGAFPGPFPPIPSVKLCYHLSKHLACVNAATSTRNQSDAVLRSRLVDWGLMVQLDMGGCWGWSGRQRNRSLQPTQPPVKRYITHLCDAQPQHLGTQVTSVISGHVMCEGMIRSNSPCSHGGIPSCGYVLVKWSTWCSLSAYLGESQRDPPLSPLTLLPTTHRHLPPPLQQSQPTDWLTPGHVTMTGWPCIDCCLWFLCSPQLCKWQHCRP